MPQATILSWPKMREKGREGNGTGRGVGGWGGHGKGGEGRKKERWEQL